MATTLKNVIQFTGLVVGVPQSLPHGINLDGRALTPQFTTPSEGPFDVSVDNTNVTVERTASSPDGDVDVYVEYFYSPESVFPPPEGTFPAGIPFILSPGGGAPPVTLPSPTIAFVFSPGNPGPLNDNVYDTWSTLVTDLATVEGAKIVQFDDSFTSPVVIPVGGPYDMIDAEWMAANNRRVQVDIPEGVSFTNLRAIGNLLDIEWNGTTPAVTDMVDGDVFTFRDNCTLMGVGSGGPFIESSIIGLFEAITIRLFNGSALNSGAGPVVENSGGLSTMNMFVENAFVGIDTVAFDVTSTWALTVIGDGAKVDLFQPSGPGSRTFASQDIVRWLPDATIHVGPAFASAGGVWQYDTSGGAIAEGLPGASGVMPGSSIVFKKVAGAAAVDISPGIGDTIDGGPGPISITTIGGSATFIRDEITTSNWIFVFGDL